MLHRCIRLGGASAGVAPRGCPIQRRDPEAADPGRDQVLRLISARAVCQRPRSCWCHTKELYRNHCADSLCVVSTVVALVCVQILSSQAMLTAQTHPLSVLNGTAVSSTVALWCHSYHITLQCPQYQPLCHSYCITLQRQLQCPELQALCVTRASVPSSKLSVSHEHLSRAPSSLCHTSICPELQVLCVTPASVAEEYLEEALLMDAKWTGLAMATLKCSNNAVPSSMLWQQTSKAKPGVSSSSRRMLTFTSCESPPRRSPPPYPCRSPPLLPSTTSSYQALKTLECS